MDLNWLISVDDHLLEPPDLWQRWLPLEYRDRGPRLIRGDGGSEYWECEGKRSETPGLSAVAGKSAEEFSPLPVSYDEMRTGCFDPVARLDDMDRAGILASLCFPSYPRFAGQVFSEMKDHDLGLACLRAYNDFVIEEWCGSAPGRYIPMTMIPLWDMGLATSEMERCAAKGARAIAFSENPYPLGYPSLYHPSRYWDPVFAASQDLQMPLCMHIGSSSSPKLTSPEANFMSRLSYNCVGPLGSAIDLICSGTLDRFPNMKVCLSESGIGWIAPALERMEQVWTKQRHWAARMELAIDADQQISIRELHEVRDLSGRRPTEQFAAQIFGCFIEDFVGVASMKELGLLGNVMIETDYPHSDSSWPNSITVAHEQLARCTDEEKWQVLQGNARRVFSFEPAEPPQLVP